MTLETGRGAGFGRFRCYKDQCRGKSIYLTKGTCFDGINLDPKTLINILYSYSVNDSYEDCRREAITIDAEDQPSNERLSQETIAHWYSIAREAVTERFLEEQERLGKIGGPGISVQLDESKFGKRKFNKGRRTEGHWVLGAIADGSDDLRLILCSNNKRSAAELLPIIEKYIEPGTIIRTDLWKAYRKLEERGYHHKTVNHSNKLNPFVSPDGTHTNRIEASWRPVKDYFRTIRLRSVCKECEATLNLVSEDVRARTTMINQEQENCNVCDGVEAACKVHKQQLKTIKRYVRKRIRQIYNARAHCESCQKLAEKFTDKLVEYLWKRALKKQKRNGFMEVIEALKQLYE